MQRDSVLGTLLLLISGFTYYETTKFPSLSREIQVINAAFVPRLVAIFLMISGVYLLYKSLKDTQNNQIKLNLGEQNILRVFFIIFLLISYNKILPLIGFEIATTLFLILTMKLCKLDNWTKIISSSMIVTALIYIIFIYTLNVPLPLKIL